MNKHDGIENLPHSVVLREKLVKALNALDTLLERTLGVDRDKSKKCVIYLVPTETGFEETKREGALAQKLNNRILKSTNDLEEILALVTTEEERFKQNPSLERMEILMGVLIDGPENTVTPFFKIDFRKDKPKKPNGNVDTKASLKLAQQIRDSQPAFPAAKPVLDSPESDIKAQAANNVNSIINESPTPAPVSPVNAVSGERTVTANSRQNVPITVPEIPINISINFDLIEDETIRNNLKKILEIIGITTYKHLLQLNDYKPEVQIDEVSRVNMIRKIIDQIPSKLRKYYTDILRKGPYQNALFLNVFGKAKNHSGGKLFYITDLSKK